MREKMPEIKDCNAELQKNKEKLDRLLDSAPDALLFVNSEARITMVNSQFENIFGYRQDEISGKPLEILIPERFRSRHVELVSAFLKNPYPRSMGSNLEIYGLKKNGEEFPADISLNVFKTEDEFYVTAAIRDITVRRAAEKQIELDYFLQKALNSMLEISLEEMPLQTQIEKILDLILATPNLALESRGAVYLTEGNHDVLTLKAARGLDESSASFCREIRFGEYHCGRPASRAEIIHADRLNGGHTEHQSQAYPHGHYCIPVILSGRAVGVINIYLKEGHKQSLKEEQFLTAIARTLALIIKHKEIETEKEKLQSRLVESEKLAAQGRITANIAHEIRNPLTAIGGLARRLEKLVKEGSKESDYAGFIASEVIVLEKILKKVLTYSSGASSTRESTNICEIIDSLLRLNEENFSDRNITVGRSFGKLQDLMLDKIEIHEAIENIIVNAIDSMPEGGQLTVTTGMELLNDTAYAYVKIQDTGAGITPENLKIISYNASIILGFHH